MSRTGSQTIDFRKHLSRIGEAIPLNAGRSPVVRKDFFEEDAKRMNQNPMRIAHGFPPIQVDESLLEEPTEPQAWTLAKVEELAELEKKAAAAAAAAAASGAGTREEEDERARKTCWLNAAFGIQPGSKAVYMYQLTNDEMDDYHDHFSTKMTLEMYQLLLGVQYSYASIGLFTSIETMILLLGRLLTQKEYIEYLRSTKDGVVEPEAETAASGAATTPLQPTNLRRDFVMTTPEQKKIKVPKAMRFHLSPVKVEGRGVQMMHKATSSTMCQYPMLWSMDWVRKTLERVLRVRIIEITSKNPFSVKCSNDESGGGERPFHYIFFDRTGDGGGGAAAPASAPWRLVSKVIITEQPPLLSLFTFDQIPPGLKLAAKECMTPKATPPEVPPPGPGGPGGPDKGPGGPGGPGGPAATASDTTTGPVPGIRLRLRRDFPAQKCTVTL